MDEILESSSLEELNQLLQNLLRLKCWGVKVSYAGSLVLDFGATYSLDIRDIHLDYGEWRLDTGNSAFQLFQSRNLIYSIGADNDIDEKDMEYLDRIRGAFIKRIAVSKDFRLHILFTGEFLLHVLCDVFEGNPAAPGWVIRNHEHEMILEVNPDRWSYRDANNPRYRYGSD